ncbi:hypothetical protein BST40_21540 [Mycobacterium persicum]|nr:hypothetical protein BST40_21540 [Mycobacterium persicum]ORB88462.1 hypothetical protein B1T49_03270 [Mycobacterium persicum]ORC00507.1 hypothetical protein B1T48_03200 [Mycobacterium persicum]
MVSSIEARGRAIPAESYGRTDEWRPEMVFAGWCGPQRLVSTPDSITARCRRGVSPDSQPHRCVTECKDIS